jgi:hypothetical protein
LDPDQDQLSNLDEFLAGTRPDERDSDHDGMEDGWEVAQGFDPNDSADAEQDPDGDGKTNLAEFQADTDPWARPLVVGWNLISFVRECAQPGPGFIAGNIWYWDAVGGNYCAVAQEARLHPWLGYWFYVTKPCQINIRTGVMTGAE